MRAVRKIWSEIPAPYLVSESWKDLTKSPGVKLKEVVAPTAWPPLEDESSDDEDEEGKYNLYFYKVLGLSQYKLTKGAGVF